MSRKITVYDDAGRPMEVDAERWANDVLPGLLTEVWDDAELLATRILGAIEDGFANRVLDAASRLVSIDQRKDRAASVLALVHTRMEEIDEAEGLLLRFLADHGDSAVVLAQLGELEAERGDEDLAGSLYRRALQVDPNCVFALERWLRGLRQRDGDDARVRGIEEIARLEGSYWSQLLLARDQLEQGDLRAAMRIYDDVWDQVVEDAAALVRVSGDLGECGYAAEVIDRLRPVWDAERHGPIVGLNIARACLDAGALDQGRDILRELDELGLPQLAEELSRLEIDLVEAQREDSRRREGVVDDEPMRVAVVPFEGPVWSACFNDPGPLVAPPVRAGARVALLSLSDVRAAETGRTLTEEEIVLAGQVSRGIPLYLSEILAQTTDADAVALIPIVRGAGPILAGEPWDREWFLSEIPAEHRPDVLVQGSIHMSGIELRAVDVADGTPLATIRVSPREDETLVPSLSMLEGAVRDALERAGRLRPRARPSRYCVKELPPELEGLYLRLLDQLHAQILVAGRLVDRDAIADEENHLRAAFDLADALDEEPGVALLACGAVLAAHGYDSPLADRFKEPLVRLLRREGPGGALWRLADYVDERL